MHQDYRKLPPSDLEGLEKQTLRAIVQALQEYSREAKEIFETTPALSETEVIVLAEDLVQYALEVAECYPINKRYAGFIDYKRVRWLSSPHGLFPQVLLVDAKASTENNRETLQQSQLCMDAEFVSNAKVVKVAAQVQPHMDIPATTGPLIAVTTSSFIHFHYAEGTYAPGRLRELKAIYALLLPHGSLKAKYNPNPQTTFFGQGKHSPARGEAQRIRVYFTRLREMCPWRLQVLRFAPGQSHATPIWSDFGAKPGQVSETPFNFIGR